MRAAQLGLDFPEVVRVYIFDFSEACGFEGFLRCSAPGLYNSQRRMACRSAVTRIICTCYDMPGRDGAYG